VRVLADLVEKQARLIPSRDAIVDPGRGVRLTYAQLCDRSRRLAGLLASLGLEPGDRVAMLLRNCHVSAELPFGIGRAGMILVNVNERLVEREIRYILADSGARAVVTEGRFLPALGSIRREVSGLEHILSIDGDFEKALARADPGTPDAPVDPADTAMLIYTSGTTGRPKGVQLTHANLLGSATNFLIEALHDPDGTYLACMPYFHVVCVPHMAALMRGMRVVVAPFELEAALALIERYRVTVAFLVPTMIAMMVQADDLLGRYDLTSLGTVLYAAAPIPVPVLRRALQRFGTIFCQMYGLTESSSLSTILRKQEHRREELLASCGREVTRVQVRVVRPSGEEADPGELGEIVIAGDNLMAGYWGRPAATAEAIRDGWLHTGDIGMRDGEGYLRVLDRKHDMIISGGFNVYPREVEDVLHGHPAVADAAVIGIPEETWGETVVGVIALCAGATVSAADLIEYCAPRLADYKRPRRIDFVEALPRNSSGKVDRVELRARYRS
jgi:acyl-CoA synthetase (AMP-forming)/AMP-acid ligase II